ncbi:MAG: carbon storage regulator [Gemmataceae bacterium]
MLVLTRKPGETIVIGDNIRLTVVALGPGRVKLGIEAPATVKIDREEIHTRKLEEEPTPSVVLHNRIAEQLPAIETRVAQPAARRLPIRKPR